jgi:hypothetical protein
MTGNIFFADATPRLECLIWPDGGYPEEFGEDMDLAEPKYTIKQLPAIPVEVPPVPDEWWITGGFQDITIDWKYCEPALREVQFFIDSMNHENKLLKCHLNVKYRETKAKSPAQSLNDLRNTILPAAKTSPFLSLKIGPIKYYLSNNFLRKNSLYIFYYLELNGNLCSGFLKNDPSPLLPFV